MRIDYDLVRDLLIKSEEITDGWTNYELAHFEELFPDINETKLSYHVKFLYDFGLTEGDRNIVIDITPRGREYLNNVRDDDRWKELKKKFYPFSSIAFSVLEELAKRLVLSKFGL